MAAAAGAQIEKVRTLVIGVSGFDNREINRLRKKHRRTRANALKFMARKVSHQISGCDDPIGPRRVCFYRGQKIIANIPRRLMVFGVARYNGRGGFKPFLHVRFVCRGLAHLVLNLTDAAAFGAERWLKKFVLDLCVQNGWHVQFMEYRVRRWLSNPIPEPFKNRKNRHKPRRKRFSPAEMAELAVSNELSFVAAC